MNKLSIVSLFFLSTGLSALAQGQTAFQIDQDAITVARGIVKAERETAVTDALQLTEAESKPFWAVYNRYRAEMDKVAEGLVKLVQEYAELYPSVPEDRAKKMLKTLTDLEKRKLATREKYLKEVAKVLSAEKTLRFAQVENRLDVALQLAMAVILPLVPVAGELTGDVTGGGVAVTEGVPGGAVIRTFEIRASVASIDRAGRKVTLLSPEGFRKETAVPPEVTNFDQLKVGDNVLFTVTQEAVVRMTEPGEVAAAEDGGIVVLTPEGYKGGDLVARTRQETATITAIDPFQRTATLRLSDGSVQTFPVTKDVDLSTRKVGDQAVFRITETVAIEFGQL